MLSVLVHYGEIGIKGKNRIDFEVKCVKNIKKSAELNELKINKIKRIEKRIIIIFDSNDKEKIENSLKPIFGIKNFSFVKEIEKRKEKIFETGKEIMKELKNKGINVIAFKTKRSDKNFELNSPEVNNEMRWIAEKEFGLKVDYKNPEKIIYIEISFKSCFIYSSKIIGLGGLPVGSVGRVLCLLSGGIDSPVAAYSMMKRGCQVDFLHIHTFASNKLVKKTKMFEILKILNIYQFKSNLFLVPYSVFISGLKEKKFNSRYSVILFKNYILKLADEIAKKYDYDAIITGDSLAQVASQTIENLETTSINIEKQIFRPLLAFDKEEIINLAKKIQTYEISIENYEDCCSLVAKNPVTKAKKEKFKEILESINLDEIIKSSMEKISNESV